MFTLKLLEDSGWYQINYSMAEPFFWGKDDGCSILSGDCRYHGNSCKNKGDEGCFYDYTFQAICKTDKFSNYCTFFTGTDFNKHDCRVKENRDGNSDNLGEYFGLRSRCFNGSMRSGYRTHGNMCYRSECQDGLVVVRIGDKSYYCREEGEKISPPGYDGYVLCPNARDFCEQDKAACKHDCTLNGRCLLGNRCYCYPGHSGPTCASQGGSGGISSTTSNSNSNSNTNSNSSYNSNYPNSNTNSNYSTTGRPNTRPSSTPSNCKPSKGFWATLFGGNECDTVETATATSGSNSNNNYVKY